MLSAAEIKAAVTQAATDAGFDLAGIAPVEDAPELEYFPRWIAAGHAGEMKYLEARDEQGRLKRASLAHAAAVGAQRCGLRPQLQHRATLLHAGARFKRAGGSRATPGASEDYHDSVMPRLRQVETALKMHAAKR